MKKYCMYCMEPLEEGASRCARCGKDASYHAPAHHISPGGILNSKYLIGAALGEGGFGITYIGRDLTLDMRVAVKEYYPNGYVSRNNEFSNALNESATISRKKFFDGGLERFLKEARILARFSGEPGIVDVRDYFEENNTAYIVMEYLDGKTLGQLLKENGTMSREEVMRLLTPVMTSLREIHKQGLIHRDISPDNIMVNGEKATLLDFGAARNVSAVANKSLSVMLTPGYAPEEQYRSKGDQGSWTDVYAISATIYRCVTGVIPDDAPQRVFADEVKTPSELGADVPAYFEKALMKGMAVFQKDRYATVDELIAGLNGEAVPDSENEDDKKTVWLSNNPAEDSEDNIVTRYLEKEEASDDHAAVCYKKTADTAQPAPQPAPAPVREPAPEPVPEPVPEPAFEPVPEHRFAPVPASASYVPAASAKKGNSRLALITVIICILSAAVLFGIVYAIIILNDVFNEPYKYVRNRTLNAEDIAQITDTRGLMGLYFENCVFENGAEKGISELADTLTGFSMKSCEGVSDLSFISLMNISHLELSDSGITDDMLDKVRFSGCPVSLILSGNPELTSLDVLSGLPELSVFELDISGTAISDLSTLRDCTNLTILKADGCRIKDLSPLREMPSITLKLRTLSLYLNNNKISDLTPLKGCRINRLEISDNAVSTLEPLSDCEKLFWISADRNKLTSLKGLENSLSLEYLSVRGNEITELSGITNCTILKWVDLGENGISDISLLSKSKETLENLYLDGNPIGDIHVLDEFKALEYLNIDGTSAHELPRGCDALIGISARNNQLMTMTELQNCRDLTYVFLADNNILLAEGLNSDKLMVCDLSGNGFNYIPSGNWGSLAAVYNNPIGEEISVPEGFPDISEKADTHRGTGILLTAKKVILSYCDTVDFSELAARGVTSVAIVDCPKDKQLSLKSLLQKKSCTVSFITPEEAQKEILSKRVLLDGFPSK